MYYVTMQITLHIPEFARKQHNLDCDVVHITTKWVFRLTLDHAIAAIQPSRQKPIRVESRLGTNSFLLFSPCWIAIKVVHDRDAPFHSTYT